MKTNSVSLDSELAAALGDCKVGDTKDITLRITVDSMDDTGFNGTVQNVVDYEEPDEEDGETPATPPASGPKGPPPPPKRAKALEDAIDM